MRAFRIAYDGTGFAGFQRQPSVSTVENALFEAISGLDITDDPEEKPTGYSAAGRTDSGVSAIAQTVSFDAPQWARPAALNGKLPSTIRAWASADVPDAFNARFSAEERTYRYYLYAPLERFDDVLVERVCEMLSGTNEYANLTPDSGRTRRTVTIRSNRMDAFLVIECSAPGFARQLVRRLVSVIRDIACGDRSIEFVERVLDPTPLTGGDGVSPAAPEPLLLYDVTYPGIAFDVDDRAIGPAIDCFESQWIDRLTRSEVQRTITESLQSAQDRATGDRSID